MKLYKIKIFPQNKVGCIFSCEPPPPVLFIVIPVVELLVVSVGLGEFSATLSRPDAAL